MLSLIKILNKNSFAKNWHNQKIIATFALSKFQKCATCPHIRLLVAGFIPGGNIPVAGPVLLSILIDHQIDIRHTPQAFAGLFVLVLLVRNKKIKKNGKFIRPKNTQYK